MFVERKEGSRQSAGLWHTFPWIAETSGCFEICKQNVFFDNFSISVLKFITHFHYWSWTEVLYFDVFLLAAGFSRR